MPSSPAASAGRAATYSWSESESEVEVRVPLPTGTRRNQLSITLHDEASGANLWRAEIETSGGAERHAASARLRVRPSFWPEALVDGILRGSVDARESSYQLTASSGGDAWDCLVFSMRKAPGTEGNAWGGVLVGDVPLRADAIASANDETLADADAARLVQRMAAALDDASMQQRCAQACVTLADAGRSGELLQAKAYAQIAIAMRTHAARPELQAAGCAVLARAPISADAPVATVDAVKDSQLVPAVVDALLRHVASPLVQLHGARALLAVANGGATFVSALLALEGVALLGTLLQQASPARDAACAALDVIGRAGGKARNALVEQGAVGALLAAVASPKAPFAWRRACARVVLPLAELSDVSILKSALNAGMLPAFVSLLTDAQTDARLSLLLAHAIGALSWRSSSAQLRRSLVPTLVNARTSRALIAAAAAHPRRPGLTAATIRLLNETSEPPPKEERVMSSEEEQRLFQGGGFFAGRARKQTPSVPVPKAPADKRALEAAEAAAEARAADEAAGIGDGDGEGLAEAGTADGAVGISAADALAMMGEAEAEAAVAAEGAASEATHAIDAEAAFLVRYLSVHFGAGAGEAFDVSEPLDEMKSDGGGADGEETIAEERARVAPAPSEVHHPAVLSAQMTLASAVAAAREHLGGVEDSEVARAAALLEGHAAIEQAKALAIKTISRYATCGELHRSCLLAHGGMGAVLDAMRRNSNHTERLYQCCATLAHMSCTAEEQSGLQASGAVSELVELYEDALVCGLDADSHRLRNEAAILLSNLAVGGGGDAAGGIVDAGGEEAVEEAAAHGESLDGLDPHAIVTKLSESPHHAQLLVSACARLTEHIDKSVMHFSQAKAALELLEAGALRVVASGLRRHAYSDKASTACLAFLALVCRWQPRAALLLRATHAIPPALAILSRALDHSRADVVRAACDLLHALAVDQATMPALPPTSLPLELADALPLLTRAGRARADADNKANDATALTIRHAQIAMSWLAVCFPTDVAWAALLSGADAPVGIAALTISLEADCSILSAESLARAVHAAPLHARLVHDGCAELRKQLIRKYRALSPCRFLRLGLVEVLMPSVTALGAGGALGRRESAAGASGGASGGAKGGASGVVDDAAPTALEGASSLAVGAVLALCAPLSNDESGLSAITSAGGLETLLPFMVSPTPPPRALLHGALLLANALRLRSDKGTLEQQLETRRRLEREEAEGTREAREVERAALLDAALPVLLRIVDTPALAEPDALGSSLDALRKLAASDAASRALLRHKALPRTLALVQSWPASTPPSVALDASELVRLLLLAASAAATPAAASANGGDGLGTVDADGPSNEPKSGEDDSGGAPPHVPRAPVAAQAADSLAALLAWVGATSEAFPPPDEFTDEEKLQRGLTALLVSMLSAAPHDAALGHTELDALRPLLAIIKTQRHDPELSADACGCLAVLCATSTTLTKQVAKLGAVKTLLLTMRHHLKVEAVNEPCARVLRAVAEASDGCRKLVLEAHGVPMLCAVMKRHSLAPALQCDGVGALAALVLHGASAGGLHAVASEKEGIEVLVGGMLLCAREKLDFAAGIDALRALAEHHPELVKRIGMANGKKYLKGADTAEAANADEAVAELAPAGEEGGDDAATGAK